MSCSYALASYGCADLSPAQTSTMAVARAMVADFESGAASEKVWTVADMKKFEPTK